MRRLYSCCAVGAVIAVVMLVPERSFAMELKVVGNQLLLSGRVVGDEPGKVTEALAKNMRKSTP